MTQEEVHAVLFRLAEIHEDLRAKVDFSSDNKVRAIWYLQGATISAGFALWDMYERGLAVPASHEWRYVNELRDLVGLLDNMSDDDRRIKAWYNGHVIERKRNEKLPQSPGMTSSFYKNEVSIRKRLSDDLSKFIHPTIRVARYNVYKHPLGEVFNYDWSKLERFNEILIIVKTALICSIHSLVTPAKSLPVSPDERNELNLLYDRVSKWSHK